MPLPYNNIALNLGISHTPTPHVVAANGVINGQLALRLDQPIECLPLDFGSFLAGIKRFHDRVTGIEDNLGWVSLGLGVAQVAGALLGRIELGYDMEIDHEGDA